MPEEGVTPEGLPPVDESTGLPTPPSPGRLPPIHLPPTPDPDSPVSDDGKASEVPGGER
jgi:hypothetical protein